MLFNLFPVDLTVASIYTVGLLNRVLQALGPGIWTPQNIINGCAIDWLGFWKLPVLKSKKKKMQLTRNCY